jgi:plasmid stability protein
MVSVNIRDFPEELHHKAKIQAAVEKTTLKELMIRALAEYLERKGVK